MRSEHAQLVSRAMKEYWARPGVKERRRAAVKRRHRIAFLQRRIAGIERKISTAGYEETLASYRAELQQLLDEQD